MSNSISIPVWFRTPRGGFIRRESLEPNEVGSTYYYVKYELGLEPENWGIPSDRPYCERYNEYKPYDEWR